MKQRKLGLTAANISIVGFGGILVMNEDDATASRLVLDALQRGVNYFDVAPSYGNAEERLGKALAPYRGQVFLSCKTLERDKEGAARELHNSLKVLQAGYFDLYQVHGIGSVEEAQQVLAPGGALEAFTEARRKGLIRYIGFSCHNEEAALMLLDSFTFDTIMFPFNWSSWLRNSFGLRVHKKAQELGLGIIALKALARRRLREGEEKPWSKCWYVPVETPREALKAAWFTLSLPVTAMISPGHWELFSWLCDAATNYRELTADEMAILVNESRAIEPVFPQ